MYFPPVLPHGGSAESAQECAKNTGFCIHEPMLHDFCKLLKLRQARGASLPGGSAARQPPPAPPSVHPVERAWFDQVQGPTGGGYLAFAYGKPQAARFSLIPGFTF